MTAGRTLTFDKDLHKLPVGAVVVNGHQWANEYVFAKVTEDRWKLFDIENYDFIPHHNLTANRPEWGAEKGFPKLNLPVYVLSRSGNREEALQALNDWRGV